MVLMGTSATELRFKRDEQPSKARYLHFATHGVISQQEPAYSYLLLSPDRAAGEDGRLHVFEILDLDLRADMVVLSACQTALGKEVSGEGIIGLTRSFLYAGAQRVVVTLWRVSDASTPQLMIYFYSGLRDGLDTLEALRQAKLRLLGGGQYSHPYHWAPFIQVGAL
jgi:CHAT domain-containing protein